MKRVIVDYNKLTNDLLEEVVNKFPDGYDDDDIINFKNAKGETIEAIEIKTEDTVYLVKVGAKLSKAIENFLDDEDDDDDDNDEVEMGLENDDFDDFIDD